VKRFYLRAAVLLGSIFFVATAVAQRIDNTSTFRTAETESYFRFHYDNDFFTKSDEYYSQGITAEFVHPSLRKCILSGLLWKPFNSRARHGVTFNLFGFTPTSIASDSILYGDRPFNANMSLRLFSVQVNDAHNQQVASALSIGIMGPAALGYQIQYNIHRWLKNPLPLGWQHQVKNDIILNYQVNYEKQLVQAENHFLLNTTAELRLGTLNNKISGGINFMTGRFNNRFVNTGDKKRKAEYYFYGQSRIALIGYDASMQGGLFNRKSPYTIAAGDVSRITFQADAGIIINFRKLFLSYTQSFLTKEFRTGKYHRWGGFSIGFGL
jgi:lipid A 3-O-deacylase